MRVCIVSAIWMSAILVTPAIALGQDRSNPAVGIPNSVETESESVAEHEAWFPASSDYIELEVDIDATHELWAEIFDSTDNVIRVAEATQLYEVRFFISTNGAGARVAWFDDRATGTWLSGFHFMSVTRWDEGEIHMTETRVNGQTFVLLETEDGKWDLVPSTPNNSYELMPLALVESMGSESPWMDGLVTRLVGHWELDADRTLETFERAGASQEALAEFAANFEESSPEFTYFADGRTCVPTDDGLAYLYWRPVTAVREYLNVQLLDRRLGSAESELGIYEWLDDNSFAWSLEGGAMIVFARQSDVPAECSSPQ